MTVMSPLKYGDNLSYTREALRPVVVNYVSGLTPLVPVYNIFILQNPTLSRYFHTTFQLHNLPGN